MIKYKYAYDSNNQIVSVDTLDSSNRKQVFNCISCGRILIPRLGKIKVKHFAHKEALTCNSETYLHRLGIKVFYEEYNHCLNNQIPFELIFEYRKVCNHFETTMKKSCDLGVDLTSTDLTKLFTHILVEPRDNDVVPDIMLHSEDGSRKLYIEIAVTHFSEQNKISKGTKIIEFKIDNESDIELFRSHKIPVDSNKIIRHNFEVKDVIKSYCDGSCKSKSAIFCVFRNGKSRFIYKTLSDYKEFLKQNDLIYTRINGQFDDDYEYMYGSQYVSNVIYAFNQGVKIRNCFLCRYHALNESMYQKSGETIFCKYLKTKGNSNSASECEAFRPDPKVFMNEFGKDEEVPGK